MPKPDPTLLNPARYPFHCDIATRFADMDVDRHINNVALAAMCEDARVRFHHASGYAQALTGRSAMMVSFGIEYLAQAYYPAPIAVYVGALELGRSSFRICQLLIQDERVLGFATSAMVCVADGTPVPLPAAFIESVKPWMLR